MIKNIFAIVFVLLTWISAGEVHACKCMKPEEIKEALNSSTAVFLGVAVGPVVRKGIKGKYSVISFTVEKSWKGSTGTEIQVKVGASECGYPFEYKRRYLVFASDEAPAYTSVCGRTKPADAADDDLESLGPPLK